MKGMSNAVRVFGYRETSINDKIDNKTEIYTSKNNGRRIFIQSTLSRKENTNENDDKK
jgi:hypothetical protein